MMEWIAEHQGIATLIFLVVFWGVFFVADWRILKKRGGFGAFGGWHNKP